MRPLVYAHRGAAIERPENTWPAFARALELGADALETDVQLSGDGQVMISHDPDGLRTAGVAQPIAALNAHTLARWDLGHGFRDARGERVFSGQGIGMLTLRELLARTTCRLNVDLKPRSVTLAAAFLHVVRDAGAEDRVTAASFHRPNLVALRAMGYRGDTSLASAEVATWLVMPAALWRRLGPRATAVQPPLRRGGVRLDRAWVVGHAHRAGLRIDYWTVNDPATARRLMALGVDGIMTDDPATIVPVVRAG
jgi:glycerophosphoryl diester phosphodiesterase